MIGRKPIYEVEGQFLTLSEVAILAGTSPSIVLHRIKAGWPVERIISTPVRTPEKVVVGDRFGKLTISGSAPMGSSRKRQWYCDCQCGNVRKIIREADLKSGRTLSCGCVRSEMARTARANGAFDFSGMRMGDHGAKVICKSENTKLRKDGRCYGLWICKCPCGNRYEITSNAIRLGQSLWCSYSCEERKKARATSSRKRRTKIETDKGNFTYQEIAERAGITEAAVHYRIKRLGMSPEEACQPSMRQSREVVSAPASLGNEFYEGEGICPV